MGCGSSRESSSPAGLEDSVPTANQNRLSSNDPSASQTPVAQTTLIQSANNVHSPVTGRTTFDTASQSSLPSTSAARLSRQSVHRHRHRGTADATSSSLSEHYNVPLQRPRPWKSKSRTWTLSQLRHERQDFFDTRVSGQTAVWEALRQVVDCLRDGDTATAQGILDAVNITLPTGHIEDGCYDERGNLYKIPQEVLTDPSNLRADEGEVDGETVVGVPTATKAKLAAEALDDQSLGSPNEALGEKQDLSNTDKGKDVVPDDTVHIKCRLGDRGTDIVLPIGKSQKLNVLAAGVKGSITIPKYARVEIFYLGKKLDQKKTLDEQDYSEGHVLNIFIVGAPK